MLNLKVHIAAILLVALVAFGIGSVVLSQDTGAGGDITCDSDLILLWYIADRFFGFAAVQNTVAQTTADPAAVLDTNRFNRGQFTALFNAFQRAQDPATMTQDPTWLERASTVVQFDDAAFQDFINGMLPSDTDTSALTNLAPASVAGELPECARLRAQLHRFFAAVAFQDLQSGFTSTFGLNANLNANDNANLNANENLNTNINDNVDDNSNDNDDNSNDNDDNGNDNDDDDDGGGNSGSGDNDNDNDNENENDNDDD